MFIGYARISTQDQNLDLQKDALSKAGCERVIVDVASGKDGKRSGLDQLQDIVRKGDVVVVWRLDRLGRSLRQLIDILNEFEQRGVGFRSLQEAIDTTTPGGKLVFHLFGALAEFERNLIRERTQAGLKAARGRGRLGGRPPALDSAQQAIAVNLYKEGKHSLSEICAAMRISRPTLYAYVNKAALAANS